MFTQERGSQQIVTQCVLSVECMQDRFTFFASKRLTRCEVASGLPVESLSYLATSTGSLCREVGWKRLQVLHTSLLRQFLFVSPILDSQGRLYLPLFHSSLFIWRLLQELLVYVHVMRSIAQRTLSSFGLLSFPFCRLSSFTTERPSLLCLPSKFNIAIYLQSSQMMPVSRVLKDVVFFPFLLVNFLSRRSFHFRLLQFSLRLPVRL